MKWLTKKQRMYNVYWHFWCKRRGSYFTDNFLWLPVEIDGEVRWLIKAKVRWRVVNLPDWVGDYYFSWQAKEFIDQTMKPSTLKAIQLKNSTFSLEEIKTVIGVTKGSLNRKLRTNTTLSLKIPLFGRVHTHGNAKSKSNMKRIKLIGKIVKKKKDFSDKTLLF